MTKKKKVLRRDMLVLASQRSGHHGVMGWMRSAYSGLSLFLNHVNPKACRPITREWQQKVNKLKKQDEVDLLIYNIENAHLGELGDYKLVKERSKVWLPQHEVERRDMVLVIRDPFNVLAGAVKLDYPPEKLPKMARKLEMHYEQVLGLKKHTGQELCVINFNEWFQSADYREQIAAQLDLPLEDPRAAFNSLQGRSSFDLHKHGKTADKMNVVERYKELEDKPGKYKRWKQLFKKRQRLVELGEEIFGINPFRS